jgi:hypothetical protein
VRREVSYIIIIVIGISIKLVKIMSMCLNEIYNRVWIHKNFFATFPIKNHLKQEDTSSSLPVKFDLACAIEKVQEDQEGFKLNGTYQLWFMFIMLIYWVKVFTLQGKTEKPYWLLVGK